jgi:hypothetical protein
MSHPDERPFGEQRLQDDVFHEAKALTHLQRSRDFLVTDAQKRLAEIRRNALGDGLQNVPVIGFVERRQDQDLAGEAIDDFPGERPGQFVRGWRRSIFARIPEADIFPAPAFPEVLKGAAGDDERAIGQHVLHDRAGAVADDVFIRIFKETRHSAVQQQEGFDLRLLVPARGIVTLLVDFIEEDDHARCGAVPVKKVGDGHPGGLSAAIGAAENHPV